MNRLLMVTLVIAIFVQSCYIDFRETVYGSGNVVTEERSVNSFEEIRVSSGIDVFITQGNQEYLEVTADDNLHEYIKTDVSGGILRIYTDVNIRKSRSKEVHLVYRQLRSLEISSAGDVKGTNMMEADNLDIHLSSAGDIYYMGNPQTIHTKTSSAGNIVKK